MKKYVLEDKSPISTPNPDETLFNIHQPKPFFDALFDILFDYVAYAKANPKYRQQMLKDVAIIISEIDLQVKLKTYSEIQIQDNLDDLRKEISEP